MSGKNPFVRYGSVLAGSGVYIYLSRPADNDLLELCKQGIFAYVLTSRQMGKSSLMHSTVQKLRSEDIRTVEIDLTGIAAASTSESQWYAAFADMLIISLQLRNSWCDWCMKQAGHPLVYRFTTFLLDSVMSEIASDRLVIFIDEIDVTIALEFSDYFFAAIRSLYNMRAENAESSRASAAHRLSFVLIGAVKPEDLIQDPKLTPFNIGKRVALSDFTYEQITVIRDKLNKSERQADQILRWIFDWTHGHPYLIMQICHIVFDSNLITWTREDVDHVVDELFFRDTGQYDDNISWVSDMLTVRLEKYDESYRYKILKKYNDILKSKKHVLDDELSDAVTYLKLSGIVRSDSGRLVVRNEIYRKIFDEAWVKKHQRTSLRQMIKNSVPVIISTIIVSIIIIMVISVNDIISKRQKSDADVWELCGDMAGVLAEQPGHHKEALVYSIKGVGPPRVLRQSPPLKATDGLVAAVLATNDYHVYSVNFNQVKNIKLIAFALNTLSMVTVDRAGSARVLNQLTGDTLCRLPDSVGLITGASISPDGSWIVTTNNKGRACVWDVRTGKCLHVLDARTGAITFTSISKDGNQIVTIDENSAVSTWDAHNGHRLINLQRLGSRDFKQIVVSAMFSPNGKTVIITTRDSSGIDGNAQVWNIKNGEPLLTLNAHAGPVNFAKFSPDGTRIVTANGQGTASIWDANSGKLLLTLKHSPPTDSISYACFSPDQTQIITISLDGTVWLWNATSGEPLFMVRNRHGMVNAVQYSSQGKEIVLFCNDGTKMGIPSSLEAYLSSACEQLANSPEWKQVSSYCSAPGIR